MNASCGSQEVTILGMIATKVFQGSDEMYKICSGSSAQANASNRTDET